MEKPISQTYKDGLVKIYSVSNIAAPGDKPVDGLSSTPKDTLRYDERTVGINRYYTAMQNKVRIDMLLRCPRRRGVTTNDIAIPNDGQQYEIKQVQYPEDVTPPSMDLSLQKVVSNYVIAGV